jgi:DNA-binding HxlR family transcriptional regulator
LEQGLARVGDRWSLLIVEALLDGPLRFNDLQTRVAGIASNVLSQRLRHLEHERVVIALPYSGRPARHSYELTEAGRNLAGALRLLTQWGADHGGPAVDPPEHAECGTVLEVRWYCPTCDELADDPGTPTFV